MIVTRRHFAQGLAANLFRPVLSAATRLRIGIGAYTYHNRSVDAMIQQLRALKVREIEMSRGEFMNFNKPPREMFESFR